MSPTQRTLALLRKTWPLVEVTEKWNSFTKTRKDLYGFVDCLAVRQDSILAVQTTSGSNVSARLTKMQLLPSVVHWLADWPRRRILIHGWRKVGARGKRKLWECREVEVVLNETGCPVIKP